MPQPPSDDDAKRQGSKSEADAWGAFGLVISGVIVWGGAGWWLSERLDNQLFVMLGMLLGMAAGLYLVWFRYGRQT